MSLPTSPSSLPPPLTARNGRALTGLGSARISTEHQDALSPQEQEARYRSWPDQRAGPPHQLGMISGRGSGECLERREVRQAEEAVETRSYDLVIAEDLGRIFRRAYAQLCCEL